MFGRAAIRLGIAHILVFLNFRTRRVSSAGPASLVKANRPTRESVESMRRPPPCTCDYHVHINDDDYRPLSAAQLPSEPLTSIRHWPISNCLAASSADTQRRSDIGISRSVSHSRLTYATAEIRCITVDVF